jgi:hypothetical protein
MSLNFVFHTAPILPEKGNNFYVKLFSYYENGEKSAGRLERSMILPL